MSMDAGKQYMVRDGAGNEYGPATVALLRQWAMEGRVTPQMMIALQGTAGYVVAGQMPELAGSFLNVPGTGAPAGGYAGGQAYGGQPQGAPYGGQYYGGTPMGVNQGMAIASLVCGLAGFMFCGVAGILAIVFGHIARGQIRREPERYGGDGMALAGLIIGYVMTGLTLIGVIAVIIAAATDSLH